MSFHDFKIGFRNWKAINISFFKNQNKNRVTEKKDLIFSPDVIKKVHSESVPVFFLSTGRCGTKYISNILEKSISLDVYHHAFPELTFHQQYAYENPKAESTKFIIDASRIEQIFESFRRNRTFVETNNRLTFFAYALADLFPKAKFVHLVRHPADFVISGIRRNWYSSKVKEDIGRLHPIENTLNWDKYTAIEKTCWLWNETNEFIENFKKSFGDKKILSVASEKIFTDSNEIEKIIHFIGLKAITPGMRALFTKPVNVQNKGIFQEYYNWDEEQKRQLKSVATLAKKYSYDL